MILKKNHILLTLILNNSTYIICMFSNFYAILYSTLGSVYFIKANYLSYVKVSFFIKLCTSTLWMRVGAQTFLRHLKVVKLYELIVNVA